MPKHVTLRESFEDGVSINLSAEAATALAGILGEFIDETDTQVTDELYTLLVDAGYDDDKQTIEVVENDLYDGSTFDRRHHIYARDDK